MAYKTVPAQSSNLIVCVSGHCPSVKLGQEKSLCPATYQEGILVQLICPSIVKDVSYVCSTSNWKISLKTESEQMVESIFVYAWCLILFSPLGGPKKSRVLLFLPLRTPPDQYPFTTCSILWLVFFLLLFSLLFILSWFLFLPNFLLSSSFCCICNQWFCNISFSFLSLCTPYSSDLLLAASNQYSLFGVIINFLLLHAMVDN